MRGAEESGVNYYKVFLVIKEFMVLGRSSSMMKTVTEAGAERKESVVMTNLLQEVGPVPYLENKCGIQREQGRMKAFQREAATGAKVLTGVQRAARLVQKLTGLLNPFSIHSCYDARKFKIRL